MADALLPWLRELVDINSGTRNRDGVLAVQRKVAEQLEAIGFRCEWLDNPEGNSVSGPLLLASLPGADRKPVVTLVSHADTVFEPASPFQNLWQRSRPTSDHQSLGMDRCRRCSNDRNCDPIDRRS